MNATGQNTVNATASIDAIRCRLHQAVGSDQTDTAISVLADPVSAGLDQRDVDTALTNAIRRKNTPVAESLLRAGAAPGNVEGNVLANAVTSNGTAIMETLFAHGLSVKCIPSYAVVLAATQGLESMIGLLLRNGLDPCLDSGLLLAESVLRHHESQSKEIIARGGDAACEAAASVLRDNNYFGAMNTLSQWHTQWAARKVADAIQAATDYRNHVASPRLPCEPESEIGL